MSDEKPMHVKTVMVFTKSGQLEELATFSRAFLEHATLAPSQYDGTCRRMAAHILAAEDQLEAIQREREAARAMWETEREKRKQQDQREASLLDDLSQAQRELEEKRAALGEWQEWGLALATPPVDSDTTARDRISSALSQDQQRIKELEADLELFVDGNQTKHDVDRLKAYFEREPPAEQREEPALTGRCARTILHEGKFIRCAKPVGHDMGHDYSGASEPIATSPAEQREEPMWAGECYCSIRMSGGVPCPPWSCPNVPAGMPRPTKSFVASPSPQVAQSLPRCRATHKNPAGSVVQCTHVRNHLGDHAALGGEWPNQAEDYDGWADQKPQVAQASAGQFPHLSRLSEAMSKPPEEGAEEKTSTPWRYAEAALSQAHQRVKELEGQNERLMEANQAVLDAIQAALDKKRTATEPPAEQREESGSKPEWLRIGCYVRKRHADGGACRVTDYDTLHRWAEVAGGARIDWEDLELVEPSPIATNPSPQLAQVSFDTWVEKVTGHTLKEIPKRFHGYLHTAYGEGVDWRNARDHHARERAEYRDKVAQASAKPWLSTKTCPLCNGNRFEDGNDQQVECTMCGGKGVIPQVAQASAETWSVVEEALPGELPSSRYSAESVAHANAWNLLRVTKDGLGFIRGMKPDYPAETSSQAAQSSLFSEEAKQNGWDSALALLELRVGKEGVAKILTDATKAAASAHPGKEHPFLSAHRDCPECGRGCRFDEDGCCAVCGRDTVLVARSGAGEGNPHTGSPLSSAFSPEEWLQLNRALFRCEVAKVIAEVAGLASLRERFDSRDLLNLKEAAADVAEAAKGVARG